MVKRRNRWDDKVCDKGGDKDSEAVWLCRSLATTHTGLRRLASSARGSDARITAKNEETGSRKGREGRKGAKL